MNIFIFFSQTEKTLQVFSISNNMVDAVLSSASPLPIYGADDIITFSEFSEICYNVCNALYPPSTAAWKKVLKELYPSKTFSSIYICDNFDCKMLKERDKK